MITDYPLVRHNRLDASFGFHNWEKVSVGAFLGDAMRLAEMLPARRHVINLCSDRYRFTVALAAALMREQISLMPPSDTPGVLAQMGARYGEAYCLHDEGAPAIDLPCLAFPAPEKRTEPGRIEIPSFPADQPAVLLFTSGSTGEPTPHLKSWGCLVRSARAAGTRLGMANFAGATIIGTVPQQHSFGLESTVLLALQHGLGLHGARPFYPGDIHACLAATPAPRILVTTPIHLRAMLADASEAPAIDLIVSATAPLAPQLAAAAEQRFRAPLLEIYGCSEAGQLAVRRTTASDEWRCLDGVELRQDESGTWASGAPVPRDVLLGDVVELRGAGHFILHGRSADLVNIAGKRTSLAHLNYHLNSIPGVSDGVFVMPEESGEATTRLMALAVAPSLSRAAVLAALRQRIDPAFLPRPLLLVEALPRNLLGKLTREAILRLAASQN
jgi:acyl-coenzyme A synthetase/AMP-(fatty) acid ligase